MHHSDSVQQMTSQYPHYLGPHSSYSLICVPARAGEPYAFPYYWVSSSTKCKLIKPLNKLCLPNSYSTAMLYYLVRKNLWKNFKAWFLCRKISDVTNRKLQASAWFYMTINVRWIGSWLIATNWEKLRWMFPIDSMEGKSLEDDFLWPGNKNNDSLTFND